MREAQLVSAALPRKFVDQAHLEISSRLLMAALREDLGGWGHHVERHGKVLRLADLEAEPVRPTSMGRFELERFPTLCGEPVERVEHLLDFLDLEGDEVLRREVSESAFNLALVLEARTRRVSGPALAAWRDEQRRTPEASSLAFFEQLIFRGHPVHPGARLRQGMTLEEQRRWAPEWESRFPLPLLGLDPGAVVDRQFQAPMRSLFPELDPALAWLPMHPWQLQHVVPRLGIEGPVAEGYRVRPSMSLRTLVPDQRGSLPHFKTALAVRITGAMRTVSVQAASNGPKLTALLARSEFRSNSLTILKETGSLHWRHEDPDRAKLMSVVMRQNPEVFSRQTDLLMPAAALIEPIVGQPLVAEVIGERDPLAWFREYAGALLRPLLRLMSDYGIALEAHLQNVVVRFRDGSPPHFFYRDFGGVRLFTPRLQPHVAESLDFAPDSATVTERVDELWSKLNYPVLQNHLGELIRALVLHFETREAALWEPVRELLEAHLTRPEERDWFLASRWRLKAMTRMRLREQVTEYSYAEVESPLWRA
ncbi:MAG: IucA/IucC family protein [Acidobacteriota bacterium]